MKYYEDLETNSYSRTELFMVKQKNLLKLNNIYQRLSRHLIANNLKKLSNKNSLKKIKKITLKTKKNQLISEYSKRQIGNLVEEKQVDQLAYVVNKVVKHRVE